MPDHALRLNHLNLTVADVDRSIAFYRRWFGFTEDPVVYGDGTVFLRNADRFDLALHPGQPAADAAAGIHFGFRAAGPEIVRSVRDALTAAGVPLTERYDEPAYVNCKLADPDGYEIEIYWEPQPTTTQT